MIVLLFGQERFASVTGKDSEFLLLSVSSTKTRLVPIWRSFSAPRLSPSLTTPVWPLAARRNATFPAMPNSAIGNGRIIGPRISLSVIRSTRARIGSGSSGAVIAPGRPGGPMPIAAICGSRPALASGTELVAPDGVAFRLVLVESRCATALVSLPPERVSAVAFVPAFVVAAGDGGFVAFCADTKCGSLIRAIPGSWPEGEFVGAPAILAPR